MVNAATLGILPRDAMGMTFRELALYAKGRNRQARAAYRQQVELTHLGAALRRAKKLPKLEALIPPDPYELPPAERRERLWTKIRSIARKGEIQVGKKRK